MLWGSEQRGRSPRAARLTSARWSRAVAVTCSTSKLAPRLRRCVLVSRSCAVLCSSWCGCAITAGPHSEAFLSRLGSRTAGCEHGAAVAETCGFASFAGVVGQPEFGGAGVGAVRSLAGCGGGE
jgi:hypothetical protein